MEMILKHSNSAVFCVFLVPHVELREEGRFCAGEILACVTF